MAVYYKFKSAKDYDSIPIDGHFISVANLKEKIFESKHLGRGTDVDLVVTNTRTNEDYCDEATMIAKHTSVVVRRVPGRPRMAGGRVFERKTPPAGYICHRCKSFGHFIQHCPTNGDPDFDIKKLKRPTGIPNSMLMETPDGSYALPSGAVAALKPNEAAFEKEIEGLPSTRAVSDISAENAGSLLQPQQPLEKGTTTKATDVSEATHESMTVKETTLEGCAALVEEEAQQKPSVSEPEKKKKKVRLPLNEADLQWRTPQDVAAVSYGMMPFGTSACNPYWGSMQLGMDMNPYLGAMPYTGYIPAPFGVPFGGILPQDPFGGCMMPVVLPQRDLSEFSMGSNQAPPVMSREEFGARKADLRRKREIERGGERDFPKDRESGREVTGNGDVSSMKSKHVQKLMTFERRHRSKRMSDHEDEAVERKRKKTSVFSGISFPTQESMRVNWS